MPRETWSLRLRLHVLSGGHCLIAHAVYRGFARQVGWFLPLLLNPDDGAIRQSTQRSSRWARRSMSSRTSRRLRTEPCLLFEHWSVLPLSFSLIRQWEEPQTYW